MKYITIATDISCDPKRRIATWACYIRYSGGAIKETGQFKEFVNNTPLLEMFALINALIIAKKNVPYWHDSKLVIYNEIDNVLTPSRTKAGNLKQRGLRRSNIIINTALPLLDEVKGHEIRDIKAHYKNWKKSSNPAKYAINRWCDIESRTLLRKIRNNKKRLAL